MSLVNMTVYVDTDTFCWIVNVLNGSFTVEWGDIKTVALKPTRKYKYEVQVPIVTIGQFIIKDRTTVNLYKLQELGGKV